MAQITKPKIQTQKNELLSEQIRKFNFTSKSVDYMTFFGLAFSISIIVSVVFLGGNASSFLDIRSILVVIGGTFTMTMISFSWKDFKVAGKIIWRTLTHESQSPKLIATQMVILADFGRANGLVALDNYLENYPERSFMRKGLELVIDGTVPKELDELLNSQLHAMEYRHYKSAELIKKAADSAPSMGLIGTLIGLVQMLANLSDPSQIGPSMAIAILTTFYGALLGNMFLGPLAVKLERNSKDELLVMKIKLLGLVSIAKQESPRKLEHLVNTLLPPNHRITYFK